MLKKLPASLYAPSATFQALTAVAIALCQLGIAWLVYATGGAQFATLHLMYMPIIVAALMGGTAGGLPAAVLGGVLLGPYMPLDSITGAPQTAENWLYRTAFFCMVGGLTGVGIRALRRQLKVLDWLNEHDARTGLLDQTGLLRALGGIIAREGGEPHPLLIIVQINNLLAIQNTFGATFGEKLLKEICARAQSQVPKDVPMALIQPDRLALVFRNAPDTQQLRAAIEANVRAPYLIDDLPVYVDFTIGAAEYPTHAHTAEELLQKASVAMHTAIMRKLPFRLYDSASDVTSRDNLLLLGMIPAALANNEFAVWHQAKFSTATRRVCSTEGLLRWAHPQRGLILPGSFIPQAEETALINNITQRVITAVLADKAAWTARGHSMGVAINLSVRNLRDRSLFQALDEQVLMHGIDPEEVELEITESAVMDDFEYCGRLISRLRDRGYRVSIDDFGTGHSSLAYLKRLPVCALKIDQAFVRHLASDANDQKIVRTILGLANALDLESVAEGVEDEAALALLREWGCTYVQGYCLHMPAPYREFMAWIESKPAIDAARPANNAA